MDHNTMIFLRARDDCYFQLPPVLGARPPDIDIARPVLAP
jgi:hypothetical protein